MGQNVIFVKLRKPKEDLLFITDGIFNHTDKNISAKLGVQCPEGVSDDLAAMKKAFDVFGLGDEHFALENQEIRDHAH